MSDMKRGSDSNASRPLPSPTRRNMLWFVLQLLGRIAFSVWFRLRARGIEKLPKKGGALLLINHQSFLDPLMVGTPLRRPVSYMGRDSLFKIPIVGFVLRNTYVFPINRESASTASMKDAIKRMRHGFLVGIFPEGTRSEDGRIGPLKPGFVSLVRRGKVPVYPVGVAGSREALPKNAWFVYPATIRVVFGDPFTPEEIEQYSRRGQEQRFIELARERISRCQQEAQEWRTGHSMESPAESDLS